MSVPEDRLIRSEFGRKVDLDLSVPESEYAAMMFPVTCVFDWDKWQDGFDKYWSGEANEKIRDEFREFKRDILENFRGCPR